MKIGHLLYLAFGNMRHTMKYFVILITTLVISMLLFYFSTSLPISIKRIMANEYSREFSDRMQTINTVSYNYAVPIYAAVSDTYLYQLENDINPASIVSYYREYTNTNLNVTNKNNERINDFIKSLFVDVKFDIYHEQKLTLLDEDLEFLIDGRNLDSSDSFKFLKNEEVEDVEIGDTIYITYTTLDDEEKTIPVECVGSFNRFYGMRLTDYLDYDPFSFNTEYNYIFTSDVVSEVTKDNDQSGITGFIGQAHVEVAVDNPSKMEDLVNYLYDTYDNKMLDSAFVNRREYLNNLSMGLNTVILFAVILFLVSSLGVFNNTSILLNKNKKTIGFFHTIGMRKRDTILMYLFQNLVSVIIAFTISIVLLLLTFPLMEDFMINIFSYYFKEEDKMTIEYIYVLICFISTVFIVSLSTIIPMLDIINKDELKLINSEE